MRREISVTIYERVRHDVAPPKGRHSVAHGERHSLSERRRQSVFQLSLYENREKHRQKVKGRVSDRVLPFLSDAIAQAGEKSCLLSNRHRDVCDQTEKGSTRKKFSIEATPYIEAKSGCQKTVLAPEHAVTEFVTWANKPKKGRGLVFVDDVTKSTLRRFFEFLVDGEEGDDGWSTILSPQRRT